MRDYEFYNVSCGDPTGIRFFPVSLRRVLRRLLRPFFFRQVELFRSLEEDIQALDQRHEKLIALVGDHVALVRRLATLEEQIAALSGKKPGAGAGDKDPQVLFQFPPGLEMPGLGAERSVSGARKVGNR
jgi:hypothetical protein